MDCLIQCNVKIVPVIKVIEMHFLEVSYLTLNLWIIVGLLFKILCEFP